MALEKVQLLNLVYPEKSEVQFEKIKFPDGQQSIRITSDISSAIAIKIYSRFNNFKDLELILCATSAIKNLGLTNIFLYIPYFLGARSDRKFEQGSIHYIKDIIAPIINSQNYTGVIVLDPHSDVIEACINNLDKIENTTLVKAALGQIVDSLPQVQFDRESTSRIYMVSPDAGALKKIYSVAKDCGIPNVITASKVRDLSTGKILHTDVPLVNINSDPTVFVIVDDICDGGRTFIEVAMSIRESRPYPIHQDKIFLIVSHGIFSNGLYELSKWVDGIYSTNSRTDIKADEFSEYTVPSTFLTQFNVY
jgi:ribose-phosphate pyrophosphokinase